MILIRANAFMTIAAICKELQLILTKTYDNTEQYCIPQSYNKENWELSWH